jgi:hypothetical protein
MTMVATVTSVILTFICTGIGANWLVQRWQFRNWLNQQRFLGSEKKYDALRSNADEIAKVAARRLSSMFRLVFSLNMSPEFMEERRKIYSDTVDEWNSSINLIYAKTTMYANYRMTLRLERDVNNKFVSVGSRIERAVRERTKDTQLTIKTGDLLKDLYQIQGALEIFNRDMLRVVITQQAATYHGVELKYTKSSIVYFSTWQLFKALFITRVDDFRVTLTSFELEPPARDLV